MKCTKLAIIAGLQIYGMVSIAQQVDSIRPITLNEIVVSVNKEEESIQKIAQQVQLIGSQDIENSHANSTADLLANQGIPVQKSQLGGGSPLLRGFEASRIVLTIDGVRMNNLIYRAGHLQDIVKTDNASFDKIEILYGPSSTMYGSDALGGVIHMFTKLPMLSNGERAKIQCNVLTRYESANKGITEHLDFNFGSSTFASLTSLTYSKFGDLLGGKNQNPFFTEQYGTRPYYSQYIGNGKDSLVKNPKPYLQVGSAYSQYDVMQKFLYQQSAHLSHGLNIQYSNSSDIPRYDRLTDPSSTTGLRSSEWYYGPQKRLLAAYDLNLKNPEAMFDGIHLGLSYQALEESRHNRNFNSKFLNHRTEKVNVIGANLDILKKFTAHTIRFGLDVQLNTLQSTASKENIVIDTSGKLDTRYPDGDNSMNNMAVYFSHSWKLNNQTTLVDGFRLGYSMLHSTLVDTALLFHLPYVDMKQNSPTYSGNIGIVHTPSDDLKLSFLISTGYRVPNIDDLAKIFGSTPGNVIVPNPDLKPEKTINYELGLSKTFNGILRWDNSIYYTDYRDIAVVDSFQYNGQQYIEYDGLLSRVFANQNRDKGYIYGFSSNVKVNLNQRLSWLLGVNYTYGRIKTDSIDKPLDHIAPLIARSSFIYHNHNFSSELFINYNGWKKLKNYYLNGEDNEQYATPEGMPAWFTLNLRLSYSLHRYVKLQAGVDNIFDTQYRTFASGINAPGRNFIIALRGSF